MTKKFYSTLFLVITLLGATPTQAASSLDLETFQLALAKAQKLASETMHHGLRNFFNEGIETIGNKLQKVLAPTKKTTSFTGTSTPKAPKHTATKSPNATTGKQQEKLAKIGEKIAALHARTSESSKQAQAMIDELTRVLEQHRALQTA